MIRAHRQGRTLTLDIQGTATMMACPAVHELVSKHISHGLHILYIDLRDCTMIDSTFSGTLLALEHQLAARDGTLILVSPSPRVLELLRRLGIEDLYTVEIAPRAAGPWMEVSIPSPDVETLTNAVLESHDELAHAFVPDASGYRAVVDELRRTRSSSH